MKVKVASIFLGFLIYACPVQAKLIEPDGLILRIIDHYQRLSQFRVLLRVRIFDPERLTPLNQPLPKQSPAGELTKAAYLQDVLVIRDELIINQTKDLGGDLLHLNIRFAGRQLEKNYSRKRIFSPEELAFLPSLWVTKFPSKMEESLAKLGVNPAEIGTEREGYNVLFRLGGPDENILVDPTSYRILGYNSLVSIDGRKYPMQVLFIGKYPRKPELPRKILYYINGRLFKEAILTHLQVVGLSRSRRTLIHQFQDILNQDESQINLDFAYGR